MNRLLSFAAVLVAATSIHAHAAANRTFVASYGLDANAATNCAVNAPCRSFAGALPATNSGGEILALDSAGYGAVTIDRSVSITGPNGIYAGITVSSGNGVTIATPGVGVVLKGLTINGVGAPVGSGIAMTNGNSLRVEDCTVTGFSANSTAAIFARVAAKVFISNTTVAGSNIGVVLDGGANAHLSRVRALGNIVAGVAMVGISNETTSALVTDSSANPSSDVDSMGFVVLGRGSFLGGFGACASCTRTMSVVNSVALGNDCGLVSDGAFAMMTVSNSVLTKNHIAFCAAHSAILQSAQNNLLNDNGIVGNPVPASPFY